MAKKNMKKHSPSLAIKEMQNKTTLRFHLTPFRISIKHHQQQMFARMWDKGVLIHCLWGCKLVQPLWKTI
jgi:hypothetical protein